jgi:hypothetical protein
MKVGEGGSTIGRAGGASGTRSGAAIRGSRSRLDTWHV